MKNKMKIEEPKGKLGVLLPGLGAVSTTLIAGVEAIKREISKPIGSLTQMGTIRLGKRTEKKSPKIKDFVPLAELDDLIFAGWDIFEENAFQAASKARVLEADLLNKVKDSLETIFPYKAVFDKNYVHKLDGPHVKKYKTKMEAAEMLMEDIKTFKEKFNINRLVMVFCASTEIYLELKDVHKSLSKFEKGLKENDPDIPPSMIYAYAAISLGIPFVNGTPSLTVDTPALQELAMKNKVPIAGKDFKTGQTMLKTVIAPALKARMLGLNGWFSTNILGNRDGEVLDDPYAFKTKEMSKLSAMEYILQPKLYPDLYSNFYHKVRINYYPPKGDDKEGWDNIDIFGWLNYRMNIKIDFQCKDSILAAPCVLDLILFMDLAKRAGMKNTQEWLSFYFKSPMHAPEVYPEHDLFIQLIKLKNTLRYLKGEAPITHLGIEYYDYWE